MLKYKSQDPVVDEVVEVVEVKDRMVATVALRCIKTSLRTFQNTVATVCAITCFHHVSIASET